MHFLGAVYFFTLLAVVCNDYFLPSVEFICEDLRIPKVSFFVRRLISFAIKYEFVWRLRKTMKVKMTLVEIAAKSKHALKQSHSFITSLAILGVFHQANFRTTERSFVFI